MKVCFVIYNLSVPLTSIANTLYQTLPLRALPVARQGFVGWFGIATVKIGRTFLAFPINNAVISSEFFPNPLR